MSIPEVITPETDPCDLSAKWRISSELARKLSDLAARLPFQLQIISGWRSREHQEELIREGKGAPVDRSTHTSCPATGADVWPVMHPADQVKIELGRVARLVGLRWGGGSAVDEQTGIPSDWNHLDLGPRP